MITFVRLEEEFKKNSRKLVSHLRKRSIPESEVDDLLQEIRISAWKGLEQLKDETKLLGWLFVIADRKIIDYFRTNARFRAIALDDYGRTDDDRPPRFECFDRKAASRDHGYDSKLLVEKLLSRLSPAERSVLVWKYCDGLTTKELAQRLKRSGAAIKADLHRSLSALRTSG